MAKALTTRSVEQVKPGNARREVPDGILPGLFLVVQPSGAKSWAVRYRHAGTPRKLTIGRYPALGLADAREEAAAHLRAIARGADPAADKQAAKLAATDEAERERDLFRTVAVEFINRHARPKNRTWAEQARVIGLRPDPDEPGDLVVLPGGLVDRWSERRVQEIARRDVIELLDEIVDRGAPMAANRMFATIRRLFAWAAERDVIAASPCAGVKLPAQPTSRDRILSDDELRWLWRAAVELAYPFGPFVQMLILTGQRRDEVAKMTAAEIDRAERSWVIPAVRAKNGIEHHVPLSDPAFAVLDGVPRIAGGRGYVFTTTGKSGVSGYSRAKANLDLRMLAIARSEAVELGECAEAVEFARWRLHDIRRTVASGMARLGVNLPVIEKVLNHTSGSFGGIVGVYQRHSFADEKRAALDAWGRFVYSVVADKPAGNVVELAGARHG